MEPGALYEVNLDDGDHTVRYKGEVVNKAALPARPKLDDEYWVNKPTRTRSIKPSKYCSKPQYAILKLFRYSKEFLHLNKATEAPWPSLSG